MANQDMTQMELGNAAFQMAVSRGEKARDNPNDGDYKGPKGAQMRADDRENYKSQMGYYPEQDPDYVKAQKASKRYAPKPQ